MEPTPPTRQQLVMGDGPDERHLVRYFLGKTRDEVYAMLSGPKGPYITEDFTYMTDAGLDYYLEPALRYLSSSDSSGDSDFVVGLLVALASRSGISDLSPVVRGQIKRIAEFVRQNHAKFGIERDPFLTARFQEIERG